MLLLARLQRPAPARVERRARHRAVNARVSASADEQPSSAEDERRENGRPKLKIVVYRSPPRSYRPPIATPRGPGLATRGRKLPRSSFLGFRGALWAF
eukprot:scaffold14281_cov102-Isochrysis_galbana.AAC.2